MDQQEILHKIDTPIREFLILLTGKIISVKKSLVLPQPEKRHFEASEKLFEKWYPFFMGNFIKNPESLAYIIIRYKPLDAYEFMRYYIIQNCVLTIYNFLVHKK